MKILVSGTWRKEIAENYKSFIDEIGKELAKREHILITGAGTGTSEIVVNSYRFHKGKQYIALLTSKTQREAVGEEIGPLPDKVIETGMDYPSRNVELVKYCDAVIALPGALGTLSEVIHAVNDYGKKVVVLNLGQLAEMIENIPELREKVFMSDNIKEMFEYLESE